MGTLIFLAITTTIGYFVGAHWAYEILGAIVGFVVGLGLLSGSIGDFGGDFGGDFD